MAAWRYYIRRAVSDVWLDTNAKLVQVKVTENTNAPWSGEAVVPGAAGSLLADDGRPVYGKWDTLIYMEIDGTLEYGFIVTNAYPDGEGGTKLELIGMTGWLFKVDFSDEYSTWERNTFAVVRTLLDHANTKNRNITFAYDTGIQSATTVGDPNPPPKPKRPQRNKHESKKDWKDSNRYQNWEDDLQNWQQNHGDKQRYKLMPWNMIYVGAELNELAKETGIQWCEDYRWVDAVNLVPEHKFLYGDRLGTDRADIAFVDGLNIADTLDPKDESTDYANKVILYGAGEGPKMLRRTATKDDGRLYQATFVRAKKIRRKKKLERLATRTVNKRSVLDVELGSVVVWDTPGFSPMSTLALGDRVPVVSNNMNPPLNITVRVTSKTRTPDNDTITVGVVAL